MNLVKGRDGLSIVVLAVAYALAAKLGLSFAMVAEQVTLVWPPTGIALAALVLGGRRLWPAVLGGALVANLWTNTPAGVALLIAVGNTIEAVLGASLLQRANVSPARWRAREAVLLIAITVLVSTPVGAALGATSLCASGLQPWAAFGTLWRDWWIGDAVGALVVAPVILSWRIPEPSRHPLETVALFAGTAAAAASTFALHEASPLDYPVHYVAFPFVIWAALRFGFRSTAIVVLLLAAIEVAVTVQGGGPFGPKETTVGLLRLQAYVAVLATSGLLLSAVNGERERLAAQLGERARSLEVRDRTKNEFLAMLGHELRNPLAPILQATRLMQHDPSDSERAEHLRTVIERQSHQLARLVDDLLNVARISSGKIGVVRRPIDLRDVVAVAVETSQPGLDAAGVTLTTTMPADRVRVDGDATRLAQVIGNLLNNAARYTPAGGHAWLELGHEHDVAVIRVRDDGSGMSPDILASAFDLFAQGPPVASRAPGGLGVGLTLVREIARLHGGTVEASSEGPGRGSELVVRLPLVTEPAEVARPLPSVQPPALEGSAKRVLVVDDNMDAAETLALLLEAAGHQVRIAHDGPSALQMARADPPEVMVLDIGLPGMSGYDVARAVRADANLADAWLVAVTGYGQAQDARDAEAAGFDRHLVKPVDTELLCELVRTVGGATAGPASETTRSAASTRHAPGRV